MKLRRYIPALILALIILAFPAFRPAYAENLLLNGNFSELDENGDPEYWYKEAYEQEEGFTFYRTESDDPEYPHAAMIENISENDARFAQTVPVDSDSFYILSGYIRAEDVDGGHGANLSFGDVYVFDNLQYEPVYDTDGQWKYVEYYGETGPDQAAVDVYARLGGYSGESTGKAWFADLSLRKTDKVPSGILPVKMYREQTENYNDENEKRYSAEGTFRIQMFVIILLYTAAACAALKYGQRRNETMLSENKGGKAVPSVILLAALLFRILLSQHVEGYKIDVNCFLSWGRTMAEAGPAQFYRATNFCDYPPLYTYVLALNSWLTNLLGGGEETARIVFRFIPSLCDITGCWILYRLLLRQKTISRRNGLVFLALAAFNPATIMNSAAWGQMDSALCLLLLAVSLCAVKGQWKTALPLYVAAVLIKPQALMLGPLGLTYIIITWIGKPEKHRDILAGTAVSILVLLAGVIPFSIHQSWDWLIQLYFRTLASYPYATVNTANFYYILGGNWSAVGSQAHILAPVLLCLLCIIYGVWWRKKAKTLKHSAAETIISIVFAAVYAVCAVLRVSWAWTGGLAMAFVFAIAVSHAVRSGRISFLPWLGGLLFVLLYVFGIKMHERYIFPAFLLLAASWILLRDRRILYVLVLFTLTVFLNEGIILDNSIRLGSNMGHLNPDTAGIADALSVFNICGALYAVWLSIEMLLHHPCRERTKVPEHNPMGWKCDRKLHWNKKDTILLTVITLIYASVSLLTLGSTKAPQTSWTSSSDEEQIVFDLGKPYEDVEILYFAQVSKHDFTVSVSDDNIHWEDEVWAEMDEGQCWKWKYVTDSFISEESKREYQRDFRGSREYDVVYFSGRYIRLSAQRLGLKLNEMLFRESDGTVIPATVLERTGGAPESSLYSDPSALLDEQDTLEALPSLFRSGDITEEKIQPSWWNSTYFDEIYHARTAYEFLKGAVPYETSHPPLGKVIMSLFVAIFGMTPFGWRFAGAMAGILMLPGMYLLGKQITKRTGIAVTVCLMMALDCMHLTQTQIATIDSFPVLFIIFAYFFMLRFIQTDFMKEDMKHTLTSLGLSGLFMGLSIASKWIGIYAGAGLAVLFFWHCIRTAMIGRHTEELIAAERTQEDSRMERQDNSTDPAGSPMNIQAENNIPERHRTELAGIARIYGKNAVMNRTILLCAWCVLFFIAVPLVIYLLSYLPYMAYNTKRIHSLWDYIAEVWRLQIHMFNYHSKPGLGMDHPFYSPWWQWPVIGKPMYYAAYQYLPADSPVFHSIFAIGNPVIWYGALAALAVCAVRVYMNGKTFAGRKHEIANRKTECCDNTRYMFILVGLLAQYLPWVLVPRGTYIYHYFASLPFLMTAIGLCFDTKKTEYKKILLIAAAVFTFAAAVFFIILFPYASGMNVSPEWLNIGNRILRIWY